MKIEFDPLADAAYMEISGGAVEHTKEIAPGIMLDLDEQGRVVGIEVLYLSKRDSLPAMKQAA
jgi:uncharacterized protein YuzE